MHLTGNIKKYCLTGPLFASSFPFLSHGNLKYFYIVHCSILVIFSETSQHFSIVSVTACKLIDNTMKQFIISSETDEIRDVEDRVSILSLMPHSFFLNRKFCQMSHNFRKFLEKLIFRVTKWSLLDL